MTEEDEANPTIGQRIARYVLWTGLFSIAAYILWMSGSVQDVIYYVDFYRKPLSRVASTFVLLAIYAYK